MIFKTLGALFVVGGLAVAAAAVAGASWGQIRSEQQRNAAAAAKNERKVVAVPEPSAMLLSALGMGSVLIGGRFVRRNQGRRPE